MEKMTNDAVECYDKWILDLPKCGRHASLRG